MVFLRVQFFPLLFLFYVNDMPQAVNCIPILFADDTCLTLWRRESHIVTSHVISGEQKNQLGKYFGPNLLKNPLLSHNTQANAQVPLYTAAL